MSRVSHRYGHAVARSPAVAGFRPTSAALALAAAFGLPLMAQAQPTGAQVIHGQATFQRNGNNLIVNTVNGAGTNHSAINWQSFSVPAGSLTRFNQPSASSASIQRVTGNNPSEIFGTLSSNGKLVLVNRSGITVGKGGVVDTAGFTASTLGMSEADAIAGRLRFAGDGGPLQVDGRIVAKNGDIVLLAPQVATGAEAVVQGDGSTVLAAGQKVEITGRGLEGIVMEVQAPANEVRNLGKLQGDAVGIFAGTLKHSGAVQARAVTAEGGKVVLRALGDNLVSGTVTAVAGDKGGQVDVLGQRVGLLAGASIDASGARGGGQVRVGGDYQGKNADVPNAQQTHVDRAATIRADAIVQGNGGRVIVWADEATRMHGRISARGGVLGGNGGFAEVSGKQHLDFTGRADLRAPRGKAGTLLLDPTDILITDGDSSGTHNTSVGSVFAGGGGVSRIDDKDLNDQLALGNVLVTTQGDGTADAGGKITVDGTALVTWNAPHSLTMLADSSIQIDGAIHAVNAEGAVVAGSGLNLEARGGNILGTGTIRVDALHASATQGAQPGGMVRLDGAGNVVNRIAGNSFGDAGGFTFLNQGNLVIGSGIFTSATGSNPRGAIDIRANNGSLSVAAGTSLSGGAITLAATGDVEIGVVPAPTSNTFTSVNADGALKIASSLGSVRMGSTTPTPAPTVSPQSYVDLTGRNGITIEAHQQVDFGDNAALYTTRSGISVTAATGSILGGLYAVTQGTVNGSIVLSAVNGRVEADDLYSYGSSSSDLPEGGAVTITAGGDVLVRGDISASGYNGSVGVGSGGNVMVTSTAGNIQLNRIDSNGGPGNAERGGATGGVITLTAEGTGAEAGHVTVNGRISAQGGYSPSVAAGNGGTVLIRADKDIVLASVSLSGGTRSSGGGVASAGDGGTLDALSRRGSVEVRGSIDAYGGYNYGANGGKGGTILIRADQDVILGNVSLSGGESYYGPSLAVGGGGQGGTLDAAATQGNVSVQQVDVRGGRSYTGNGGDGGTVILKALSTLPDVDGASFGNLAVGDIFAQGGPGQGDAEGGIGIGGQGGTVLIEADKHVQVLNVSATGGFGGGASAAAAGGQGGNVQVRSMAGNVDVGYNNYDPETETGGTYTAHIRADGGQSSNGNGGKGGTILLEAKSGADGTGQVVVFGDLSASGGATFYGTGGQGGEITLAAHKDLVIENVSARGGNATLGPAGGQGGLLLLSSATGSIQAFDNIDARGGYGDVGGRGGTIDLSAGQDVNAWQILAHGGSAADEGYYAAGRSGGDGGSVSVRAGGSLQAMMVTAYGGRGGGGASDRPDGGTGGHGGSIAVDVGSVDLVESVALVADGGSGGDGYHDGTSRVGNGGAGGNAGSLSLATAGNLNLDGAQVYFARGEGGLGPVVRAAPGAIGPTLFFKAGGDMNLDGVDFGTSVSSLVAEAGGSLYLGSAVYTEGGDVSLSAGLGDPTDRTRTLTIAATIDTTGPGPAPTPPPIEPDGFAMMVAAAPSGAVTLSGPTVVIDPGQTVTSAGELHVIADAVTLNGSTNSGANRTVFRTLNAGRRIILGDIVAPLPTPAPAGPGDDDTLNALSLTSDELTRVHVDASSTLVVGDGAATGGLDVADNVNFGAAGPALSLVNNGAITQVGNTLVASRLNVDGNAVTLTDVQVDTLSGRSRTGAFRVTSTGAGPLTIGTVDGISGVASDSAIQITTPGLLHIDDGVSSTAAGTAVVLAADQLEVHSATAVSTPAGRWLVYLSRTSPDLQFFGPGSTATLASGNLALWGRTFAGNGPTTIAETGNRYVFAHTPTVTVTADAKTKVYDGTPNFALTYTHSGLVDAAAYGNAFLQDTFTGALATPGVTKNVGTYAITQGNLDVAGYAVGYVGANATITQRNLNVNATGIDRVYNGTTAAGVNLGDDRVAGDALTIAAASSTFGDKHVGTNKAVTVSGIGVSGTDAGNYNLVNTSAATTATITAAAVTVSAVTDSKVYDGTTASLLAPTVSGSTYDSFSFSQSFDTRHAGTGKTITASGTIDDGNGGNNYVVTFVPTATGTITPRAITVSAAADTKVYDGTTFSGAAPTVTSGSVVAGDSASFSQSFDNRNAGSGKTLSASAAIDDGNGGGNYAITVQNRTDGVIQRKAITVAASADTKVYDGTTVSAGGPTITSGSIVSGDSSAFSQKFGDRNAGTGKTLLVAGKVEDGNGGANYDVTMVNNTSGVITRRQVTVTANADTKVYDATTSSAVAPTFSGGVGANDSVTIDQVYADKNAGTGKVIVPLITVSDGNGGANYEVALVSSSAGVITPKQITTSGGAAADRQYDATRNATLTGTIALNGVLPGDDLSVASHTATFADKNVGVDKPVTVALALGGTDAGNYTVQPPSDFKADITKATATVGGFTARDKVYDGTTAASFAGTPTVSGVFAGDSVSVGSATGTFADKNVGNDKAVQVTGLDVSGADAGNYLFLKPTQLVADITPAPLTIQAKNQSKLEGATKTFNGTEFTASGLVAGEHVASVSLTSEGAAASAPTGSYAIVASNAVGGSGFSAGNYDITYLNGALAVFAEDVKPAIVQVNNQVVTFATLFVEMARQQQEQPDGRPDIVLTDTSCTPR